MSKFAAKVQKFTQFYLEKKGEPDFQFNNLVDAADVKDKDLDYFMYIGLSGGMYKPPPE
jgi:hypothetical protein